MPLSDILSPIRRQKVLWIFLFIFISAGIFLALTQLPAVQKNIIYFSVKPLVSETQSFSLDAAESTSKVAEAIAGWAQNPAFRNEILQTAGVNIGHFKRKVSARKQNNLNVFWTIKLYNQERQHADKILDATIQTIQVHFLEFNEQNAYPYALTPPQISKIDSTIPTSWLMMASILMGFVLSFFCLYLKETLRGRISFVTQLESLVDETHILHLSEKLGQHDQKLLERFILTFESPRLVGTFPAAEEHFSLAPSDAIDENIDTPIFLVRLGETRTQEIKNLRSIFGENCGAIVFEQ